MNQPTINPEDQATHTPEDLLIVVNHLFALHQQYSNRTIDAIMSAHDTPEFQEELKARVLDIGGFKSMDDTKSHVLRATYHDRIVQLSNPVAHSIFDFTKTYALGQYQ